MTGQADTQAVFQFSGNRFQPTLIKFDHPVAVRADDVMVMTFGHVMVMTFGQQDIRGSHAGADVSRTDDRQSSKQIQCAEDAGPPH